VSLLVELLQPKSIVDFGCNSKGWLSFFRAEEINELWGIAIDKALEDLEDFEDKLYLFDFKNSLTLNQSFDLALCLEVAETIPKQYTKKFIGTLSHLSPVILFAAAIPMQGRRGHLNEQWQPYWAQQFQAQGFVAIDFFRKKLWNNPDIDPYYAQNLLLFVRQECLQDYPQLASVAQANDTTEMALVHPKVYLHSLARKQKAIPQLESAPLVSIIIPCYEQAQYLSEAVASVVVQTYNNWEIIIVNDGSPDNTSEVAQKLIAAYPTKNIRLLEQENKGSAEARNAGIAIAAGEYILPLDADDKLSINALALMLKVALQQDLPCVVFGSYENFGTVNQIVISANLYSPEKLKTHNVLHNSSLYSKQVWETVGGYASIVNGYEDWDFWLNCHKHHIPFYGIQEVILYYRRAPVSGITKANQQSERLHALLVCRHSELYSSEQVSRYQAIMQKIAVEVS
jgi:hypothetical protein